MGVVMSLVYQVMPSLQKTLREGMEKVIVKEFKDFEDFHMGFLDILTKLNSTLPGIHCEVPKRQNIEECYKKWKDPKTTPQEKEKMLTELLQNANRELFKMEKPQLSKMVNPDFLPMVATGIVAPPAAMMAKRGTETIPQLKMLKMVPDALFVPSATLIALTLVKFFSKNTLQEEDETDKENNQTSGTKKDETQSDKAKNQKSDTKEDEPRPAKQIAGT